ncbi:hypothetical protein [Rhizobacter sp. Root1221]|jgi:hypothetical protein|uniref:hypothetical protein n=1 Tax=Rhizobacter sp. Root1221 TaxID=1736433 RepID=UPI0006F8C578|nr:hypothetical protein [Rhizobacter sp. Root1221]KQV90149.1 hypothetical protein ASC87_28400 [Rhizobacter sp. Root1221]
MDALYLPAFDQAMQFLFERHGNSISEDLVEAYCACGYLKDIDGVLTLTDTGRAELRRRRRSVATN